MTYSRKYKLLARVRVLWHLLTLLALVSTSSVCVAQTAHLEPSSSQITMIEPPLLVGPLPQEILGPPEPLELRMSSQEKLNLSWNRASRLLTQGLSEPQVRSQVIEELEAVGERMRLLDLSSAESWSLTLIQTAEHALAGGDHAFAAALVSWAYRLSPASAEVSLRAMRVSHLSGYQSFLQQVFNVAATIGSDRAFQLSLLSTAIYPMLWGLTISLYVLMVLAFALGMNAPLRFIGLKSYQKLRGVIAPVGVLTLLTLPIVAGPLWALMCWGLTILVVLPRRRWLALYAGVVIGLWGALIPIRESLDFYLSAPRVSEFVRSSAGHAGLGDSLVLSKLALDYQGSAELQYVLGVAERREGALSNAQASFSRAQAMWKQAGSSSARLAVAQLGLLDYMQGDFEAAEKKLLEAQSLGLSGHALTLNLSKVAFAKFQIDQSLALSTEVERSNPGLTLDLREREERFGDRSPLALAEIPLPFFDALQAVLAPESPLDDQILIRASLSAQAMMYGSHPILLVALGAILVLLFLVQGAPARRVRKEILYAAGVPSRSLRLLVRLIPGGTALWAGLPGIALILLSIPIFFAMPFLGWPWGALELFEVAPSIKPLLGSFLGLWLIGTVYAGWHLKEREE